MVDMRYVMVDLDKPLADQFPSGWTVPAKSLPPGFRTTESQPFASDSIWNTPIGVDCAFETAASPATASFLSATPAINDTLNGYGFYNNIARPTDPLCTITSLGNGSVFNVRVPYDPVISTGTDLSLRVIDGRWAIDSWKTTKVNDYAYTGEFVTRTDLLGTGRNAGTRAARFPTAGGLIRAHELGKCYIPHALCISIPAESLKRGFVWPAAAEDAPSLIYTGQVPMGSFFAIPPNVDINTLGLSQEGFALAECLQNYGMYVGDQSGSAAISVDGEAAVSMRSALERMRSDWAVIFAQLRRVTNVGTKAGGPGARKVAPSGPVTLRTDAQDVSFDVLVNRVRANGGFVLTSDSGLTDVDPLVSTDAALGGKSLAWTGWPAQYRKQGGAIKRVAVPDGQTRILLMNPGKRNVRIGTLIQAMHSSGFAYMVFGASSSSDSYRLAIASGGACHLQKIVGGTSTAISSALPNGSVASGKHVECMIYGPTISVKIDGETVEEVTDTTNLQGTQCGIYYPSDINIAWKNITVHSVPRLFRKPVLA
ncbi:minor tail protein [Gordonia phage Camerico]|nr:minor tail protein [Gordonia phage Camerico]